MPDDAQQPRESPWSLIRLGGRLLAYAVIAAGIVIVAMILNSPELNSPEPKHSATTPSATSAQAPALEPNPSAPAPSATAPAPLLSPALAPVVQAPASPPPLAQASPPAPSTPPAPATPVATTPPAPAPSATAPALAPLQAPATPPTATTAPSDAQAAATNVRKSSRYSHTTEAVIPGAAVETPSPPLPIGTPPKSEKEARGAKALRPVSESVAAAASKQFPNTLLRAQRNRWTAGRITLAHQVDRRRHAIDRPRLGQTDWAVQLGALRSEVEAKSDRKRLTAKYPSALNGSTISERLAIVNGETVYRLRVVDLSKAGAEALCTRLKVEGGNCFIVK